MKIKMSLIKKFEAAVRADEMRGGGDPNEIKEKEEEYRKTKQNLIQYIKSFKEHIKMTSPERN